MLPHPEPALAAALAADLRAAGYTSDGLRSAWTAQADDAIARGLRRPALRALGERTDALAVLARLLGLGVAQPRAAVDAALPATGAEGLALLGLAEIAGDTVRPAAMVRPQSFADHAGDGEWWIASDLDEAARGGGALPEDHVLGVGGASLTLAGLQLPDAAETGLDLGTGCGIQALRMRRSVSRVVATDVSERALAFTRLNALLNGVDGIDVRAGSLFDPVAGERFDRIATNPPFVITPRRAGVPAYEYRDGGRVGDALVAEVIGGAGAHLTPGGVAQLLGNWESRDGDNGLDRVRGWVEASAVPLDAWVIERERLDPLAYAELWVRDGGTVPGSAEFADLVDAWLDDFAARGVTGIGFGYVLLRRPADGAPTLARYERVAGTVESAPGAHLAGALAAHDRLAGLDDDALAASRFLVAPDVTEARHHRPGEEAPTVIELRQGGGFGRALAVDPGLAALVGASDGDLAVGVLVDAIAQLLEVDAAALRSDLLPRVRELAFTGFLRFAD
ncbi:class I SAM-dependent methyltransferase [Microbacterium lushaniae]|nr:class I SAM-dependent methyltransferase [Microbacterium lushaniae]KAA9155096.1 class I SAM-dependent methyltransferase [Microbacterium lushaniae]